MAGMLVVVFAMPAAALENVFGGYWRTRLFTNQNFDGHDKDYDEPGMDDITRVDTRTRIYYTAILNDNLKFVNKFEMNATWGGQDSEGKSNSYGDIGADGVGVKVKNSYVDFTIGAMNAKVGVQGGKLARGLILDDDFSGAKVSFGGGGFSLPITWIKAFDEDTPDNKLDVDYFIVSPTFGGGGFTVNPFGMYVFSDNASSWDKTDVYNDMRMWYAGLEMNINADPLSFWAVGIYQGGEAEWDATKQDIDINAWMAGGGITVGLGGAADLHGQFIYATGDEDGLDDEERSDFFVPKGQSYYWSEIMGYGVFDSRTSKNSPGDQISNIMIGNLGTTIKPTADLSISLDAWYGALVEDMVVGEGDDASEENELGIEANVKITYTLVEGLDLDLVGAYLFAGEVTTMKNEDEADPYEIGTRLSLSF